MMVIIMSTRFAAISSNFVGFGSLGGSDIKHNGYKNDNINSVNNWSGGRVNGYNRRSNGG